MLPEALGLTWPVFGAVLFGALLHASWNALVKSSSDKSLDMAVIHLIGSALAIPLVALVGWPPAAAWPYIAASVVIHIGYYIATTQAYKHGDLGLTYPLMRGVAPLLVALSATFTLHETLTPLAWAGIVGISCGVLVLGLSHHALHAPKAVGFALVNAVIIAIYTVVDALGVRASGHALQYIAALFLFDGWPFALLMFARRGRAMGHYARQRWPVAAPNADNAPAPSAPPRRVHGSESSGKPASWAGGPGPAAGRTTPSGYGSTDRKQPFRAHLL